MPSSQKILIIEDDRLQFRVTEQLLASTRLARFEVDWASTYEDGLHRLLTGDYAVCLLDYQLGEHDGLELLRQAGARNGECPVIFLTADDSERIDTEAMEAGASDYLVKGEINARMLERSIRYSLKLSDALRELRRLATSDALTGLRNRRAFDAVLSEEVSRAQRLGHPCSLVILDLDHFKTINDTHGHLAGDAVLTAAARALEAEVRNIDRVARIGGEEFAVLLMETAGIEALAVAERLVKAVREHPATPRDGEPLVVTISAGVASLGENDTEESLVAAADKALYQAKNGGRNCAVLAS